MPKPKKKNDLLPVALVLGGAVLVVSQLAGGSNSLVARAAREAPRFSNSLDSLHPDFRTKMDRVFAALRRQGWSPVVGTAWRNRAWQALAVRDGRSKLAFSLHNVTSASGRPAALAVDVVQAGLGWPSGNPDTNRAAWDKAAAFAKALGAAARAEGLGWGGNYSQSNAGWAKYGIGWDPAHVTGAPESSAVRQALASYNFPAAGVRAVA